MIMKPQQQPTKDMISKLFVRCEVNGFETAAAAYEGYDFETVCEIAK